ncbi:sigma-54-dependent transcriptional regulator [candidate division CSSED10-310 bacterium]|uniref:Sigma-54-dependent transcriptional regulator n=1 Tax=candidate division CSSED10-310 bacterium TaxID=2855610 RepID=A0ABV6YW72_UNCC1
MSSILVVDDERSMREFLTEVLTKEGHYVSTAPNGPSALQYIENEEFDLAVVDIKMPGMDGLELLECIKKINNNISVIMMTAYGSEKTAVNAIKQGASNYLKKPFESVDELKIIIKKELESLQLKKENILLKEKLKKQYAYKNIVGQSVKMSAVFDIMTKVANLDSTILITGESGTGKELVASAIHYNSLRKEKHFVTVSCGALPENLLESELFGHKKGAFTGAISNKVGLFELAKGGTFLLDEIGEAPLSIQVKLLRVLQNKTFKRVGGTNDIKVDVRIITATNKNLEEAVANGSFREDLYYRLNVIPIHIPPLRDRHDDIRLLVDHFVQSTCSKHNIDCKKIDEDVYNVLNAFPWPGNVRQLENVVERMIALEVGSTITVNNLPQSIKQYQEPVCILTPEFGEGGVNLQKIMEDVEKKYLLDALERAKGTKKTAADLLNISFRSFRYRLRKFSLDDN